MEGKRYCANSRLSVGLAWSPGGRDYMQDAFCVVLNHESGENVDFLGMFDGHGGGGEDVAKFVAAHLCDLVVKKANGDDCRADPNKFSKAIVEGCLELDETIKRQDSLKDSEFGRIRGGSTSLAAWFKDDLIYCANIGDSRMVISVNGEAVSVTHDHKPQEPDELRRIRNAGGFVSNDNRINDYLAVARSFGDFAFKEDPNLTADQQMVTAFPQVTIVSQKLKSTPIDFIVMGTDGIWDNLSNETIAEMIHQGLRRNQKLEDLCENIVMKLKAECEKQDNMTLLIAVPK